MDHPPMLQPRAISAPRFFRGKERVASGLGDRIFNITVLTSLLLCAVVTAYALITQKMYLCMEAIFLGFIPYILWSARRRAGVIDCFAPDVGFPIAYVLYLFAGSIQLPIETQFGLVLPWIQWFYYIAGLFAYMVGVRLFPPPPKSIAAFGTPKLFWPRNRFLVATMLLLAIGLSARMVQIARSGLEILHMNDTGARVANSGGLLGVLGYAMEAVFLCFLLYLLARNPRGPIRILLIACMILIWVDALATTNRSGLLRMLIAGLVIFHYLKSRLQPRLIIASGLVMFVLVSIIGTFRDISLVGEAHIRSLEQQGFTRQTYWLMSGYDVLRLPTETFYMTIQEVPVITQYSYGTTSLASLAQFLPGHRPGPSEIVKNKLRLQFVGFGAAATILAPLWFDGGIFAVIIGMLVFGIVARLLHQRVLFSQNCVWLLLYGWFVQNALKAIKDDILPDLGVPYIMVLFIVLAVACGRPSERIETGQLQSEPAS